VHGPEDAGPKQVRVHADGRAAQVRREIARGRNRFRWSRTGLQLRWSGEYGSASIYVYR